MNRFVMFVGFLVGALTASGRSDGTLPTDARRFFLMSGQHAIFDASRKLLIYELHMALPSAPQSVLQEVESQIDIQSGIDGALAVVATEWSSDDLHEAFALAEKMNVVPTLEKATKASAAYSYAVRANQEPVHNALTEEEGNLFNSYFAEEAPQRLMEVPFRKRDTLANDFQLWYSREKQKVFETARRIMDESHRPPL